VFAAAREHVQRDRLELLRSLVGDVQRFHATPEHTQAGDSRRPFDGRIDETNPELAAQAHE